MFLLAFPLLGAGDWIDLNSLSAWRGLNSQPISAVWSEKNGEIIASGRGSRPIVTRGDFHDFEFAWEWSLPPRGNSGVKYLVEEGRLDPDQVDALRKNRVRGFAAIVAGFVAIAALLLFRRKRWAIIPVVGTFAAAYFLFTLQSAYRDQAIGFEYQMIDDDAIAHPTGRTSALYELVAPANAAPRPLGEWNESRIIVRGSHVEHWLNGARTVAADIGSPNLDSAIARSKFRSVPGFATKQGAKIALTHHSTDVHFRNLRVRRLEP